MRFPIDAVFLDASLVVLASPTSLDPWRAAGKRGAKAVWSCPRAKCARRGLAVGDSSLRSLAG